ncbi:MAG: efflux RND transporter periplasmic adaptor subunit [Nitrospirota bacterium]
MALVWLVLGCQSPASQPEAGKQAEQAASHQDEHAEDGHAESEERGGLITLSPQAQQLAGITVEEVARRSLQREVRLPGTIQANQNRLAHVGPRIQGRVVVVSAGLGDRVESGATLAMIDSPELGQAESDFVTARAKFVVAEKAYERAKTLLDGKVIGTGEFQRREGDYLASKAEAQAAEDRLRLLGLEDPEIADVSGTRSVRSQVAITAPLTGTVVDRDVTLGEVVEPAKTLFTIADLSALWGVADISERDLPTVKKGLPAKVSVSAYPREVFSGKVTYISDILDPSSRTAKVRVEIDNARGKLKPEMFATFVILTEETEGVLSVPEHAVQRDGGNTIVFVSQDAGFEKRLVELGPEQQGYYPIQSGLKAGEIVVTKGAFVLKSESERGQMEEGHGH